MLDARSLALAGEPSWIRSNLEVYTHGSTMTSHDWIQLVQSAGDYMLADLFPDKPRRAEALYALLAACNAVLNITSAFDSENRDAINALKLQCVEALVLCESVLPRSELAVVFHVLLHVPDACYRWNAVRNFWSFFAERYVVHVVLINIT